MTFAEFIKSLFAKEDITQPLITGKIEISELAKIVKPYAKEIYLSDGIFQLTSVKEASKFTAKTKVTGKKYTAEGHDCDNFSFALMGYWSQELSSFAFGIAWSGEHAFNWMVDDQKELWVCEPQTNSWMKINEAQKQKKYKDWRFALC